MLKADKSNDAPHVDALLSDLGNTEHFIPYYAVFRPGKEPVHFNGVFRSPEQFLERAGLIGESMEKTPVSGKTPSSKTEAESKMDKLAEGFEPIFELPPAG